MCLLALSKTVALFHFRIGARSGLLSSPGRLDLINLTSCSFVNHLLTGKEKTVQGSLHRSPAFTPLVLMRLPLVVLEYELEHEKIQRLSTRFDNRLSDIDSMDRVTTDFCNNIENDWLFHALTGLNYDEMFTIYGRVARCRR